MASPARPAAAASVSGAFGLAPDPKRCSFDQALRREDFQEKRLLMSFVNFHDQEKITKKIVTEAIEDCMNKQADNLLQSLDVISGRLSQLELYCYKLERSIGELRSDVMDYHSEANQNIQCLEKNVKEVQKSVQVLQDKQELAETQNELNKLQVIHEDSAQNSEGTAPSVFMARENDLALLPFHHAGQSPAMQFQSCNGVILQQLVPVSLSNQQNQQCSNHTAMYCMQGQSHLEHRQAQPVQDAAQSLPPHTQNHQPRTVEVPQMTSQAPDFYLPPHQQWPHQTGQQVQTQARQPQAHVVQQQQYNNVRVPSQVVQLQTSSPQAHSAPQVTFVYPSHGSYQPAHVNMEAQTRGMVVQPSYSTTSSPQRKHHEVAPIFVQSNLVSIPMAVQHQQPQQPHPLSNGSFGPQPGKAGPGTVTSYMVQGSEQTYNTAYGSPSSNPPTLVAVLNQHSQASTPMMLNHLGPQPVQNHRVDMAERAVRIGYSKDQAESIALRMVAAAGQPSEFNPVHDRLSSVGNVVAPQTWSG